MPGEVTALRTGAAEPEKGIAVGVSVAFQLDEGSHATLQTHFDQGMPPEEADRVLDWLMARVERQRARAQIPELQSKIDAVRNVVSRLELDQAECREKHAKAQADREIGLKTINADRDAIFKEGYDRHVADGRKSQYQPQGARKESLDRHTQQAGKLAEELRKAQAEHEVELKNRQTNLDGHKRELAELERQIEKRQRMVAGAQA